MKRGWTLAIDFGTSFTVAALRRGDEVPEVIEIDGERRVPSVLLVDDDGDLLIGRAAEDLAPTRPQRVVRAPKSRLGDAMPVVVAGRSYTPVRLVSAVLASVYHDAVRHEGHPPDRVRLTHPVTWTRPRIDRLVEAALAAGLPNPEPVAEPIAAAAAFADDLELQLGQHVAVYDLGGGTFDTVVLRKATTGFEVVGRPAGDASVGGELFDELLAAHLGAQLPADVWEAIQVSDDVRWRQASAALRNESRRAKEALSTRPFAEVLLPLPAGITEHRITSDELDALIAPYVAESVALVDRTTRDAGLTPEDLAALLVVGGASRSRVVERQLREAFPQLVISRRGDPKSAVALGATRVQPFSTVNNGVLAAPDAEAAVPAPGTDPTADATPAGQSPDSPALGSAADGTAVAPAAAGGTEQLPPITPAGARTPPPVPVGHVRPGVAVDPAAFVDAPRAAGAATRPAAAFVDAMAPAGQVRSGRRVDRRLIAALAFVAVLLVGGTAAAMVARGDRGVTAAATTAATALAPTSTTTTAASPNLPVGSGVRTQSATTTTGTVALTTTVLTTTTTTPTTTTPPVAADTWPPGLEIDTPSDGQRLSVASVEVTGRTEPGALLTVNDQPVEVAADGSWSVSIELAPGDTTITAVAVDAAGNRTTGARAVNYSPTTTRPRQAQVTTTTTGGTSPPPSRPAPTVRIVGPTGAVSGCGANYSVEAANADSFSWSNGLTGATITVQFQVGPGPYQLTVTARQNDTGRTATATLNITVVAGTCS